MSVVDEPAAPWISDDFWTTGREALNGLSLAALPFMSLQELGEHIRPAWPPERDRGTLYAPIDDQDDLVLLEAWTLAQGARPGGQIELNLYLPSPLGMAILERAAAQPDVAIAATLEPNWQSLQARLAADERGNSVRIRRELEPEPAEMPGLDQDGFLPTPGPGQLAGAAEPPPPPRMPAKACTMPLVVVNRQITLTGLGANGLHVDWSGAIAAAAGVAAALAHHEAKEA